jgi:hypothetical protein
VARQISRPSCVARASPLLIYYGVAVGVVEGALCVHTGHWRAPGGIKITLAYHGHFLHKGLTGLYGGCAHTHAPVPALLGKLDTETGKKKGWNSPTRPGGIVIPLTCTKSASVHASAGDVTHGRHDHFEPLKRPTKNQVGLSPPEKGYESVWSV